VTTSKPILPFIISSQLLLCRTCIWPLLGRATGCTALGPTQPPIQWVPGALSLWVKRPAREINYHLRLVPRSRIVELPHTSSFYWKLSQELSIDDEPAVGC
jgi:hypothetical protein